MPSPSLLRRLYLMLLVSEAFHPALSTFRDINNIAEARLMRDMDFDGRVAVRPTAVYSKPVNVTMSFYLQYIKGLDIVKQELSLTGNFIVAWNDPFLAWDPTKYDNVSSTQIPATSVWTPRFFIVNSLDGQRSDNDDWKMGSLEVRSTGTVYWYPGGVFNMACEINIFSFPFDKQTCKMSIMPLGSSDAQYPITGLKSSEQFIFGENLEWKFVNDDVTTTKLSMAGYAVSNVVFSFTIKRQSTFHVLTVIVPVIVLFIVGLMVFALPADSGEKVSLCVACLMSYFLTQVMISEQIPKSWTSVPVIMVFNTAFMLLTVLSVCFSVLVLNLHHRKSDVPGWLHILLAFHQRIWQSGNNQGQDGGEKSMSNAGTDNPPSSGIVEEIGIARNVKDGDGAHRKWEEVAAVGNTISCGIYIFLAVVMSCVFITLWAQS